MSSKKKAKKETGKYGFHFALSRYLANGDGRSIKQGATFIAQNESGNLIKKGHDTEVCGPGLHASEKPIDAWAHVRGMVVSYVYITELASNCDEYNNKFAGRVREHIKVVHLSAEQHAALNILAYAKEHSAFNLLVKSWLGVK